MVYGPWTKCPDYLSGKPLCTVFAIEWVLKYQITYLQSEN